LLAKHRLRGVFEAIRVGQQYEFFSACFWQKSAVWLENEVPFLSLPDQGLEGNLRGSSTRSGPIDKEGVSTCGYWKIGAISWILAARRWSGLVA